MKLSKSILIENYILKANSTILLEAETYTPTDAVAKEAQQAIDAKEKHGDKVKGGTQVGWTRARQLANKEAVSIDTIKRMVSFFARHDGNQKSDDKDFPWSDNGYTAWKIWGGDAGKAWAEKVLKQYEKENKLEELTLDAFRVKDIISSTTQKYKDERKTVQGVANKNTKFILSEIEGNDVIFKFLLEATEKYPKDHVFKVVNPSTKEVEPEPSKTYELWIKMKKVLGENGWLDALGLGNKELTMNNIKELFDVADIEWWVNDMSFLFQGFQYWLTQLDASIFPENRKPKRWDKIHGDGQAFTTKHMAQVIDQLPFFRNIMASSLTTLLRKEGYITTPKK